MQQQNATLVPRQLRLRSLDALRGFDMCWIVSGEGIFHGIASVIKTKHGLTQSTVDWQISTNESLSFTERVFIGISNQLHHTVWNGFTFYDLIFPLFIFIAGVSMQYSFSNQLNKPGIDKAQVKKNIYRSLSRRTVLLLLLGMVVNGALQLKGYENTRFASVLGRIALSCFFAAMILLHCSLRAQLVWAAVLLIGYWAVMSLVPVPGFGQGVFTPEGNVAAYADRLLLPGKLHRKVYDPEGVLSTLPAIVSALLGVFTGRFLKWDTKTYSPVKKVLLLFVAGILLVTAGWLWGFVFPVNKNMWTSSFVLFAGGWCVLLMGLFYYVIDVLHIEWWSRPLVWMGSNAVLIYIAAHGLVNFEASSQFLFGGMIQLLPAVWHDALLWTGVAIIQFGVLYLLYRKQWFLKL